MFQIAGIHRETLRRSLFLAVIWFVSFMDVQFAAAAIVCKLNNDKIDCGSGSLVSEQLSSRLLRSLELFAKDLCRANEVSLPSEGAKKDAADEVEVGIRYECGYPQNENGQLASQQKVRLRYEAVATYEFLCARVQYKMFESGFDFYNDGTRMHWDSRGSSRPIPWQQLPLEARDSRLIPLFHIWCE